MPQLGYMKSEELHSDQRSHYGRSLAEDHGYQARVTEHEAIQDKATHETYAKGPSQREPKDNFIVGRHVTGCWMSTCPITSSESEEPILKAFRAYSQLKGQLVIERHLSPQYGPDW